MHSHLKIIGKSASFMKVFNKKLSFISLQNTPNLSLTVKYDIESQ